MRLVYRQIWIKVHYCYSKDGNEVQRSSITVYLYIHLFPLSVFSLLKDISENKHIKEGKILFPIKFE